MANFARRIVSGNKARFKDEELDVELDLVYVTDNVIIMGYPGAETQSLRPEPRIQCLAMPQRRVWNHSIATQGTMHASSSSTGTSRITGYSTCTSLVCRNSQCVIINSISQLPIE
jgi:hypothetical protein